MNLKRYLPIAAWLPAYRSDTLRQDLLAALIVTVMLVPQSLAYALLAGVPPQVGLYASIAPLLLYALFGTSQTLSVGPVAVIALMTATTAATLAPPGSADYLAVVTALALLSGLMLVAMGVLRLGFVANFLSHPVISGFISASAVLIALSQLKHIFGVAAGGDTLPQMAAALWPQLVRIHAATFAVGAGALLFLAFARKGLGAWLLRLGVGKNMADSMRRLAPMLAVVVTSWLVWQFGLAAQGVKVVGMIPTGLPPLGLPRLDGMPWQPLLVGAFLISMVGFVESVSVGQTLAAKRRGRIDPDQELIGLGAANLGAAFSGGMPVTGGFSRSVVNDDAGAQTPAAGIFTALGILAVIVWLTPLLYHLPLATLAATIIVAVLPLFDAQAFVRTWRYDKADFAAMLATVALTLLHSVESGIIAGVLLSIGLHLYRTGRPHVAELGRLGDSEHFRNVQRHLVATCPQAVFVRIDESLYFPNARFLEDCIGQTVGNHPQARHVVLVCSAVNHIDTSALESLMQINRRLQEAAIGFHLAEVKGPVFDRLQRSGFINELGGDVFLSTFAAWQALTEK